MKTIRTLVVVLILLALAGFVFIYSGLYDVAASTPDNGLLKGILETTRDRAVASRLGGITPPKLDDPQRIRTGLVHYHEMCATCHGAPGVKISEIGQGLNPYPPELAARRGGGDPRESFWIVKNGLKMTGMPSFGVTHSDEEIWAIVAFLHKMPALNPQQYQDMVKQAGLGEPPAQAAESVEHAHP